MTKLKANRRKEIIKIKAEEKRNRELAGGGGGGGAFKKINKTKSCFFEKINKIDKPLAGLTKKKRNMIQITKIWNKRGYIMTNLTKTKGL